MWNTVLKQENLRGAIIVTLYLLVVQFVISFTSLLWINHMRLNIFSYCIKLASQNQLNITFHRPNWNYILMSLVSLIIGHTHIAVNTEPSTGPTESCPALHSQLKPQPIPQTHWHHITLRKRNADWARNIQQRTRQSGSFGQPDKRIHSINMAWIFSPVVNIAYHFLLTVINVPFYLPILILSL